jgi:hypothetical protein
MADVNPKNYGSAAAADLGVEPGSVDMETEEEKKKKRLQQQQELMGRSGASVYGAASMSLLGGGAIGG